jgi:cytochrome c
LELNLNYFDKVLMKKIFLLFPLVFIYSYSHADETGKQLAQESGCLACHSVKTKVLGPSYQDVAKKYKQDKTAKSMLVKKIKNGGKGNWGNVPMPPHPKLKEKDIEKIVTWILSI